jgi:hypothetical protein
VTENHTLYHELISSIKLLFRLIFTYHSFVQIREDSMSEPTSALIFFRRRITKERTVASTKASEVCSFTITSEAKSGNLGYTLQISSSATLTVQRRIKELHYESEPEYFCYAKAGDLFLLPIFLRCFRYFLQRLRCAGYPVVLHLGLYPSLTGQVFRWSCVISVPYHWDRNAVKQEVGIVLVKDS